MLERANGKCAHHQFNYFTHLYKHSCIRQEFKRAIDLKLSHLRRKFWRFGQYIQKYFGWYNPPHHTPMDWYWLDLAWLSSLMMKLGTKFFGFKITDWLELFPLISWFYFSMANVMYIYFLDLRVTLVGISKYVCLQLLEFSFPSVLIPFSLIKKGMEHIKMVKTVTKCFHKYQYFIINPSRGNKLE